MRVGYLPKENKSNKYTDLILEAMKLGNIEVSGFEDKDLFKKKYDCINFNWFENVRTNCNFIRMYIGYLWKKIIVYYCKVHKIKIIWTVHNKISHGSKYEKYSLKMMKLLAKKADAYVIHCNETRAVINQLNPYVKNEKIFYVPHPNYISTYNSNKFSLQSNIKNSKEGMVCLFIGQVRPYKNVEHIIKLAKEYKNKKIKFIIAGKPQNKEYEDTIRKLSIGANIEMILKFLDDEEMVNLIKNSDIVILPYDLRSSLNSGTVILAFSEGKNVICPEIGTINDIKCKDLIYSYKYDNEEQHFEMLKKMMDKSYRDFLEDKNKFIHKGILLKEYVKEHNSLDVISKKYVKIFKMLS